MAVEVATLGHTKRPGRCANSPRPGRHRLGGVSVAKATCLFAGCDDQSRRHGLCQRHDAQLDYRGGDWSLLTVLPPRPARRPCVVCGAVFRSRTRLVCSGRCRVELVIHPLGRPTAVPCSRCGGLIDLTSHNRDGRRRRADTKTCSRCRNTKAGVSPTYLATRDGTTCGLCGRPVDLSLKRNTDGVMCASVDHIVPVSKGGTNDPSNLQLAHLACNQAKAANDGARTAVGPRSDGREGSLPWP